MWGKTFRLHVGVTEKKIIIYLNLDNVLCFYQEIHSRFVERMFRVRERFICREMRALEKYVSVNN